jgi:hypothetical protein
MKLRSLVALALALSCASAFAQVTPGTSPLTGAKGGTNNAFMQFSGPAASMKTYTLANASDTIAMLGQIQTWTGAQSFTDGTLILLGLTSGSTTLKAPATGGGTATLFSGTDTVVGRASTDTLTNKTLTSPVIASGIPTAAGALGFGASINFGDGTINHALVGVDLTQTLTSKTLTSPTINGGSGAFTTALSFILAQNASTVIMVTNTTSGTGALAGTTYTQNNGLATFGAASSGYTGFPSLANKAFIYSAPALGGIEFYSDGANPIDFYVNGSRAGGFTSAGALTGATFNCASNTCTVRAASDITGQLPIGNGGTGQATAAAAISALMPTPTRAGDIAYWNGSNWVTIAGNNSGTLTLQENASGVPVWASVAGTGTVTSVICGTGLSGGTITTSGTCAVSLTTASNVLGADVAMSSSNTYFAGPSMAQGATGVWFASGTVTFTDSGGASQVECKLWDGTNIIASSANTALNATAGNSISLSGTSVSNPPGNIRIDCKDLTTTTAKMVFNFTGNSKDSSIFGHRIQ